MAYRSSPSNSEGDAHVALVVLNALGCARCLVVQVLVQPRASVIVVAALPLHKFCPLYCRMMTQVNAAGGRPGMAQFSLRITKAHCRMFLWAMK